MPKNAKRISQAARYQNTFGREANLTRTAAKIRTNRHTLSNWLINYRLIPQYMRAEVAEIARARIAELQKLLDFCVFGEPETNGPLRALAIHNAQADRGRGTLSTEL